MTQKNKHINEEDFRKYLKNQMTSAERNLFERELQKHPFEAEALEGFQHIHPNQFQKDLNELKNKIHPKKRKNNYRYWAAAASILLIVTAGIIWIQIDDMNSVQEVVEIKAIEQQEKMPVMDKKTQLPETEEKETELLKEADIEEVKNQDKGEPNQKVDEIEIDNTILKEDIVLLMEKENREVVAPQKIKISSEQADSKIKIRGVKSLYQETENQEKNYNFIRGKIVSADDSFPIPGVSVIEKGTGNGIVTDMDGNFNLKLKNADNPTIVARFVGMETYEFQPATDSVNLILLEPSQLGLDEVIAVGYGEQKKETLSASSVRISKTEIKSNNNANPICGMTEFEKYLEEEATLPADFRKRKETVKILLKINSAGKITDIENTNKTDSTLFEMAKQIIWNGSEWNPEIKEGTPLDSEVEIKIVFRKKK